MYVNIGPYPEGEGERRIEVVIDPYDTWGMDHTLSYIILPMLHQLKKTKHGVPSILFNDGDDSNSDEVVDAKFKEWEEILDKMIFSFNAVAASDIIDTYDIDDKIQEGLNLFGKYYRCLWD